jgi:hypothetical protein
MRTTLDIEDDVLIAVRTLAKQRRRPMGAILSALARESLRPRAVDVASERNGVPVFPAVNSCTSVDMDLVNSLRDELPQ